MMDKPDEALLWARNEGCERFGYTEDFAQQAIAEGLLDHDASVIWSAYGYRAGHAAPMSAWQVERDALVAALRAIASPDLLQSYGDPTVLRDYACAALDDITASLQRRARAALAGGACQRGCEGRPCSCNAACGYDDRVQNIPAAI